MKDVVIAVRPESLGMVKGRKKDGNWIQGTIERISLSAGILLFKVSLVNDRKALVKRFSPSMKEEIDVNDVVSIYFDPDSVIVYPYPREGLHKALEVT